MRAAQLEAQAELVEAGGRLIRRVENLYRQVVSSGLEEVEQFYQALTSTRYYDMPAGGSPRLRLELLPVASEDWKGKQTRVSVRVALVTRNAGAVKYDGVGEQARSQTVHNDLEEVYPLGLVVHDVAFSCAKAVSSRCILQLERLPEIGFRTRFERKPAKLGQLATALGIPPHLGVSLAGVDIVERVRDGEVTWSAQTMLRGPLLPGANGEMTLVLFEHGEVQEPIADMRERIRDRIRDALQQRLCSTTGRGNLTKRVGVEVQRCSNLMLTRSGVRAAVELSWQLPETSQKVDVSATVGVRYDDGKLDAKIVDGSINAGPLRKAVRAELERRVADAIAGLPEETREQIDELVGVATTEQRASLITDALDFEAAGRLAPPRLCAKGKLRNSDAGWEVCVSPEGTVTWNKLPDPEALLHAVRRLFHPDRLLLRPLARRSCDELDGSDLLGGHLVITSATSASSDEAIICRFTARTTVADHPVNGTELQGRVSWKNGRVQWKTLRFTSDNLQETLDALVRARFAELADNLPFTIRDVRIDRGTVAFRVYVELAQLATEFDAGEVRIDVYRGRIGHEGSLQDFTSQLLADQLEPVLNDELGSTDIELGDVQIELASQPVDLSYRDRAFVLTLTGNVDFAGMVRIPLTLHLLPELKIDDDDLDKSVLEQAILGNLANLGLGFLTGSDPPVEIIEATVADQLRRIEIKFDLKFPLWKFEVDLDGLTLSTQGLEFPVEIGGRVPGYIPAGPFFLANPGFSFNRVRDDFSIRTDIVFSPSTEYMAKIDARLAASYKAVAFTLRGTLRLLGVIPLYQVRGDVEFKTGSMELVSESVGLLRKFLQSDKRLVVDGREQTFRQQGDLGVLGLSITESELVGAVRQGLLKAKGSVNLLIGTGVAELRADMRSLREWFGRIGVELFRGWGEGTIEISTRAVVLEFTVLETGITIRVPTLTALTPSVVIDAVERIFDVDSLWDAIKNFDGDIVVDLVGQSTGESGGLSAHVGDGDATIDNTLGTRQALDEPQSDDARASNAGDLTGEQPRWDDGPRRDASQDNREDPTEVLARIRREQGSQTSQGQSDDVGFSQEGYPMQLRSIDGDDGAHLCWEQSANVCAYYLPKKAVDQLGGVGTKVRILDTISYETTGTSGGEHSPPTVDRVCFGKYCLHFGVPDFSAPSPSTNAERQSSTISRFGYRRKQAVLLLGPNTLVAYPVQRPVGRYTDDGFRWYPESSRNPERTLEDRVQSLFSIDLREVHYTKSSPQLRWNRRDTAVDVLHRWVRQVKPSEGAPEHLTSVTATCQGSRGPTLAFSRWSGRPRHIVYEVHNSKSPLDPAAEGVRTRFRRNRGSFRRRCLTEDELSSGCGKPLVRLWMQTLQTCGGEDSNLEVGEEARRSTPFTPRHYSIRTRNGADTDEPRFRADQGRQADAAFIGMVGRQPELHFEGIFSDGTRNASQLYSRLRNSKPLNDHETEKIRVSFRKIIAGLSAPTFHQVAPCPAKAAAEDACRYDYAHPRPKMTLSKSIGGTATHRTYGIRLGNRRIDLEFDPETFRRFGGEQVRDATGTVVDLLDHGEMTKSARFEAILRFLVAEERALSQPRLLWIAPDGSVYFTTRRSPRDGESTQPQIYIFQPGKHMPGGVELVEPFPPEMVAGLRWPRQVAFSKRINQPVWQTNEAPTVMRRVHRRLVQRQGASQTPPRLSLVPMAEDTYTAWLRHGAKMVFVPAEGSPVVTSVATLTRNWRMAADCGLFQPSLLRRYRSLLDKHDQFEETPTSRWTDAAIPLLVELMTSGRWRSSMQVHPSFLLAEHHRTRHVCINSQDNQ